MIQLKILTIIIRCIVKKDDKYYPEIYLDECLYGKKIFKKIGKDINRNYVKIKFESRDNIPANILVNVHNLVLAVKYQKVYISTCQYDKFFEEIQMPDNFK